MKESGEFEKHNLEVDREIEVDDDNPQLIVAYLATWFDVDKKFHLHINDEEDTWLNMYALYNPYENSLRLNCIISRKDKEDFFSYEPTEGECKLIKDMVSEKLLEGHNQTPKEFCESYLDAGQKMGE